MTKPAETPIRAAQTPHDKLCAAIGILQAHYLAADSLMNGKAMWGGFHMPSMALEQAIQLLIEILEPCEALGKPQP